MEMMFKFVVVKPICIQRTWLNPHSSLQAQGWQIVYKVNLMSALFQKQYCASPVRYGTFNLSTIRKAFVTVLGKTPDSWYQRLQKLLILLPDSGEQFCGADTMFLLLNTVPNFTARAVRLQAAPAVLIKENLYLSDHTRAAILLLSVFPAGWRSEVWGFDIESASQAAGSVLGHTSLLEPEGTKKSIFY